MKKIRLSLLCLVVCVILWGRPAVAAGTTSFEWTSSATQVGAGQKVMFQLKGKGLSNVYAYEAEIDYDPALLTLDQVAQRSPFSGPQRADAGKLVFAGTKSGQVVGESGDLVLAEVRFVSATNARASVTLRSVRVLDPSLRVTSYPVNAEIVLNGSAAGSGSGGPGGSGGSSGPSAPSGTSPVQLNLPTQFIQRDDEPPVPVTSEQLRGERFRFDVQRSLLAPVSMLKNWLGVNAQAALDVQTTQGRIRVPVQSLLAPGLSDRASLSLSLEAAPSEEAARLREAAVRSGAQLLSTPVQLGVTAVQDQRQMGPITTVKSYIECEVGLESGANPVHAVGVMLDPVTGELLPVPTTFTAVNGKTTAALFVQGSGIYTVVQAEAVHFDDLASHWSQSTVETLAGKMIIQGSSLAAFEPNRSITRAEFMTLLTRSFGLYVAAPAAAFNDVGDDWFAKAVGSGYAAGLVTGYPDGSFQPNGSITRAEIAVMLERAARLAGTELAAGAETALQQYRDREEVQAWAVPAIAGMLQAGIMEGNDRAELLAASPTTRAEAAVMLGRLLRYAKLLDN